MARMDDYLRIFDVCMPSLYFRRMQITEIGSKLAILQRSQKAENFLMRTTVVVKVGK